MLYSGKRRLQVAHRLFQKLIARVFREQNRIFEKQEQTQTIS